MKQEIIDTVQSFGFDVYMRDGGDTYFYYTDGVSIGYAQMDFGALAISTVHRPCYSCGTGYKMGTPEKLTKEAMTAGFAYKPAWASMGDDVEKWKSMQAFLDANTWNAGFKKLEKGVDPCQKQLSI